MSVVHTRSPVLTFVSPVLQESQRPQMYNDSHSRALNKVQRGYFRVSATARRCDRCKLTPFLG